MRRLLSQSWGIFLLFAVWQVYVMAMHFNSIVIVTPVAVAEDIALHPGAYVPAALWTLGFAVTGLVIGLIAGVALAILSWSSRAFSALASPVALLLSSTPVVCLIPLLARIFGYDSRTELAIVVLLTFFPAFVYSASGMRRLPPMSNQYFKSVAAGRSRRLSLLALPAAAPSIATAFRICSALSVLVSVVAEYLMQTGGLGNMFALTSQAFETERAFGASILAMVMSSMLYFLAGAVERRIVSIFG